MKRVLIPVLVWLSLGFAAKAQQSVTFPLKLSTNKKYLTDSKNKPFLIKEISAWGLIQALSEADESAFIDSVKRKGFNTLMVSIISYDTRFAGSPPDWQGISPFKTRWDLSTYNLAYFDHADRFLRMAKAKGMLVLLVPCYLGYKGDKNQGWWDELLSPNNSVAKSRVYGQFLGQRYQNFSNIIWEAGGDNKGDSALYEHMDNIIQGIKQADKQHLWTGHFESAEGTNWSTGDKLYAKYIDIDGLYDFTESALGKDAPQYKTELEHYGKGKMIFQLDQSYEHDIPHGADNENPQWIRRKNYDGLLSGCAGTSFCPGEKDNTGYVFTNWQPLMNTDGMQQMRYCFKLFSSRAWQRLVPVHGDKIIKAGRGTYGTIDYVCAAQTVDHNTFIAYLPVGGTLNLDLAALNTPKLKAWWYDPRTGKAQLIGTFAAQGTKELTAPTQEDWLLVVDNAEMKLGEPGK
ncbi:MAG: apiosidase-like domain-containing protein [Mucilaginibacter sp.]